MVEVVRIVVGSVVVGFSVVVGSSFSSVEVVVTAVDSFVEVGSSVVDKLGAVNYYKDVINVRTAYS